MNPLDNAIQTIEQLTKGINETPDSKFDLLVVKQLLNLADIAAVRVSLLEWHVSHVVESLDKLKDELKRRQEILELDLVMTEEKSE